MKEVRSHNTSYRIGRCSCVDAVYICKTTHEDYIHSKGLESMANTEEYRKDIVAGGLGEILWKRERLTIREAQHHYISHNCPLEFDGLMSSLGSDRTDDPWDVLCNRHQNWLARTCDYLRDPVEALGQVYTCFKIVRSPVIVPFSLATVQLVNNSMSNLYMNVTSFAGRLEELAELVDKVRRFYELLDSGNQIEDGTIPFPENQADISMGISVEFRNVSFRYSEKDDLALTNVSFKIEQGQLCVSALRMSPAAVTDMLRQVIVGENGSGKSTILSLLTRIYDVTEGEILLNGIDIRKLKLSDVRKAVAVLYQEYAIFPVNVRSLAYPLQSFAHWSILTSLALISDTATLITIQTWKRSSKQPNLEELKNLSKHYLINMVLTSRGRSSTIATTPQRMTPSLRGRK